MAKTKQSEPQTIEQPKPEVKVTKAVKATTLGSVGASKYKPIPRFNSGCKNC